MPRKRPSKAPFHPANTVDAQTMEALQAENHHLQEALQQESAQSNAILVELQTKIVQLERQQRADQTKIAAPEKALDDANDTPGTQIVIHAGPSQ